MKRFTRYGPSVRRYTRLFLTSLPPSFPPSSLRSPEPFVLIRIKTDLVANSPWTKRGHGPYLPLVL